MERDLTREALQRRIVELEERLAEYERKDLSNNIREAAESLEKIVEMGDDGIEGFKVFAKLESRFSSRGFDVESVEQTAAFDSGKSGNAR